MAVSYHVLLGTEAESAGRAVLLTAEPFSGLSFQAFSLWIIQRHWIRSNGDSVVTGLGSLGPFAQVAHSHLFPLLFSLLESMDGVSSCLH